MSLNKLHPRLQDYVKDKKWTGLTPIQKEAFDPIYKGNNCIIEAPTSGGKTEAVLFPLLTRISSNKSTGFKILYIAPLKALLNDLTLRVIPYAKMCYLEAFKWHGDVSQGDKVNQMLFPSDILLTTPESIEAILLRRGNWIEAFQNLETIVIDEAHYFALTERGSHLICLLQRIDAELNRRPQRIAVTATIGNPNDLLTWLTRGEISGMKIKVTGKKEKPRDFLIHFFEQDGIAMHDALYRQLINKKSIIFERSRTGTEDTATRINERNVALSAKFPVKVKTHHSSVSKRLREEAEDSIKKNSESSLNAIISTSTLELGIDIGELDQVIQIGGLNSSGSFLQRVGRTGRRPGQSQYFRGMCTDPQELVLLAACVNLGLQGNSESILFPKKAFHILAHQIICLCLQKMGTTAEAIWQILSKASCFTQIMQEEFDELIEHMIKEDYLRRINGNILLVGNKTENEFLRANWKRLFAIFDTGPMYNVVDGKKVIGTLDSGFARFQELPFVFVLAGQEWNAKKIDHELQQVSVEKNKTGIPPKWKSIANFDIPFELAQETGRLLQTDEQLNFLDLPALNVINMVRNSYNHLQWKSDKWVMDFSEEANTYYLFTFSGDKINRSLTLLLRMRLDAKVTYDYCQVVISFGKEKPMDGYKLLQLTSSITSQGQSQMEMDLINEIETKWFSKFSECLPKALARQTIIDKDYDFPGLIRELQRVEAIMAED
jgi:ATP-dependent helicase Lhr and Lhr-like helicase